MRRWREGLRNLALGLLSREPAGLVMALLMALAGVGAALWLPSPVDTALAALAGLLATGLALASMRHLFNRARIRRAHPPPGRLVDLGGYRVHVLAEGEARDGSPPVVWFAGGHAGGYALHHLHRALRQDTRSILIDRPGTGWSDTGPFPRSTAREAEEMVLALERAGEKGPFVWAGHSFGGLLAANIARRRPDLVHTLVLLDPTPLETIVFGPRLGALADMRRTAWLGGLAMLFGVDLQERADARARRNPIHARVMEAVREALGAEAMAARALDRRAGHFLAAASIYRELSPEGVAACAWSTVVYDRDLGELPVWLVAPQDNADAEIATLPEAQAGDAANARRMFRFFAATRERYLATSTRSRRIVAPAGSGHNFVYEAPEFTIGVVREALRPPAGPALGPSA
jgi:pimeloyl-ACP methyl ester carboxylesterase